MRSFLLRFEEGNGSLGDDAHRVLAGTMTITEIRQEESDRDPGPQSFRPLRRPSLATCTMTKTRSEQSDADACGTRRHSLFSPPIANDAIGTQTATAVREQADDKDAQLHSHTPLPRCS